MWKVSKKSCDKVGFFEFAIERVFNNEIDRVHSLISIRLILFQSETLSISFARCETITACWLHIGAGYENPVGAVWAAHPRHTLCAHPSSSLSGARRDELFRQRALVASSTLNKTGFTVTSPCWTRETSQTVARHRPDVEVSSETA